MAIHSLYNTAVIVLCAVRLCFTSGGTAVPVVFELCKHCAFGHTFALVGDAPELGEWDVTKALRLEVRRDGLCWEAAVWH